VGLGDELERAAKVRDEASTLVRAVIRDARLEKVVELEHVSPVVEKSLLRYFEILLRWLVIKD